MNNSPRDIATCKQFDNAFRAELAEIRERHNRSKRASIPEQVEASLPTTALDLTGLACSGGGIRFKE